MTKYPAFDPDRDIPSLAGKTIVVTGGTAGLGSETISSLSKHNPKKIIFTGRNEKAANALIDGLKGSNQDLDISFAQTDFSSLAAVKTSATRIAAENPTIDLLICNAGIMAVPPALTKEGYELQFGTNHLAHALLIKILLPSVLAAHSSQDGDARIIILSSIGAFIGGGLDFPKLKTENSMTLGGPWRRYGASKLANILYAQQLAIRYPAITTVSIHPGVIWATELGRGLSMGNKLFGKVFSTGQQISLPDGAKNQLWAATTAKANIKNGAFYEPVGELGRENANTKDKALADRLWEWTEEQLTPFA